MDLIVYFMSLQLPPSFNSVTGRQCEYYIDSANIGVCQSGTAEIKRETRNQLSSCNIPFFFFGGGDGDGMQRKAICWNEILINTFLIRRCRVIWSLYAGN